jgi:addiction module HigA family antidote
LTGLTLFSGALRGPRDAKSSYSGSFAGLRSETKASPPAKHRKQRFTAAGLHAGRRIKALCLEPLNLTVTEAARCLGISRKTLSGILNGHAGISPEMAFRLSIAFNTSYAADRGFCVPRWPPGNERSGSLISRFVLSYAESRHRNTTWPSCNAPARDWKWTGCV